MKKYLLTLCSAILAAATFAQDLHSKDVPSIVRNTFRQKFSLATDLEWEKKQDVYKVEFEIAHVDHEAWIGSGGQIERHQFDIKETDLPDPVKNVLKKEYAGYKLDDLDQIEEKGQVYYKIELKRGRDDLDIFLDSNGKIVKPK